jgi:site-specific recombinase XerD
MNDTEILEQFQAYLERQFPERRTSKDYLSDLRQFRKHCQTNWRDVTMHDIDQFVDQQRQQGLKTTTINRRVAALKTFFDFLAEELNDLGWINPVRYKRHGARKERRLPRDLNDQVIEQVWQVIAEPRDQAWFVLMLRGGLRVGEVVGLRLNDVLAQPQTEQPARLRVYGKGRKERMILLSADAYAVLDAWLAVRPQSEYEEIFLNDRGKPLATNGVEWLLHRYGEQAGVRLTPHQLRHTYARQLTEAQMPITSLSKLMGHTQVTTTQIYTQGADPKLAQAYQEAMGRLTTITPASATMPVDSLEPVGSPQPLPPTLDVPVPPPAAMPERDQWAPDLPEAILQASLDYVYRLAATWKPNVRRNRTFGVLSELKNFWTWQLSQRPIQSPLEMRLSDLHAYQQAGLRQGKRNTTINRRLDYVMGLLRQLADQGQAVDGSVFRLHTLPRPESLPRHLSDTEIQHFEALLRSRIESTDRLSRLETACALVLAHTGIRSGECAVLQRQDIDLQARRLLIRQGKGQRDRMVYLSDLACQALTHYLQDYPLTPTSPLWIAPTGKPISQLWLQKCIASLGQQAGIPDLQPHRLRHTFATRLLNAGVDITRIQKLLGHDRLTTTMIYARVYDATVEADYRSAMHKIEALITPLSSTSIPITQVICDFKVQVALDNSV